MVWFYAKDGKQQGPLDEADFGKLARTGVIKPADLVWTEEFGPAWRAANSVAWIVFSEAATPPAVPPARWHYRNGLPLSAGDYASTDFRSATPNGDLMTAATASLRGRWGIAVGVLVVWAIGRSAVRILSRVSESPLLQLLNLLYSCVSPAIFLGLQVFWLNMSRTGNATFVQTLSGFRRFWTALGADWLVGLEVTAYSLLVVVPGGLMYFLYGAIAGGLADNPLSDAFLALIAGVVIYALFFVCGSVYLSYSQVIYLLADNPGMGAMDAIRRSKWMMAGNRWKLFWLGCRFIGWGILCLPTLGIGFLWLGPCMWVSYAKFYDDLQPV